jgi:hypothetical protein
VASVGFVNGPAKGVEIRGVRRLPVYLRVVARLRDPYSLTAEERESGGLFVEGWDVLDQLDDEPREGEVIHFYLRKSYVFACTRRGGSDPVHATYAALPASEEELEEARSTEGWRALTERWGAPDVYMGDRALEG